MNGATPGIHREDTHFGLFPARLLGQPGSKQVGWGRISSCGRVPLGWREPGGAPRSHWGRTRLLGSLEKACLWIPEPAISKDLDQSECPAEGPEDSPAGHLAVGDACWGSIYIPRKTTRRPRDSQWEGRVPTKWSCQRDRSAPIKPHGRTGDLSKVTEERAGTSAESQQTNRRRGVPAAAGLECPKTYETASETPRAPGGCGGASRRGRGSWNHGRRARELRRSSRAFLWAEANPSSDRGRRGPPGWVTSDKMQELPSRREPYRPPVETASYKDQSTRLASVSSAATQEDALGHQASFPSSPKRGNLIHQCKSEPRRGEQEEGPQRELGTCHPFRNKRTLISAVHLNG